MLEGIDQLYVVSRGKKVTHLDLKASKPGRPELESLLIGPSGNLRAPTARKGRTLVVGFDEEAYATLLK